MHLEAAHVVQLLLDLLLHEILHRGEVFFRQHQELAVLVGFDRRRPEQLTGCRRRDTFQW
jgi:hypothetical protein